MRYVWMLLLAGCAAVPPEVRAPTLVESLTEWALESGYQLIAPECPELGLPARKVGPTNSIDALNKLLAGTSLTYSYVNGRTVAIRCDSLRQ